MLHMLGVIAQAAGMSAAEQVADVEIGFPILFTLRQVGQTIAFRGLLGWAFGPRNFMKNGGAGAFACQLLIRARAVGRRKRLPHQLRQATVCGTGFSTLSSSGSVRVPGTTGHKTRWPVPPGTCQAPK